MATRYYTSAADLQTFSSLVKKWLDVLGIKSYLVSFRRAPSSVGGMASVKVEVNSRSARFTLATTWPREITVDELESCALHECLHVLMAQLVEEAVPTAKVDPNDKYKPDVIIPADPVRVDREEEAVVMTLE